MTIKAVFDANVFISAVIKSDGTPGKLFKILVSDEKFELVITHEIEEEIKRVFRYPDVRKLIRGPIDSEDWLDDLLVFSDLTEDVADVNGVSIDPEDDKYLSACLSGKASFLVTGDDHLLRLSNFEGVRIVTPREFLEILTRM